MSGRKVSSSGIILRGIRGKRKGRRLSGRKICGIILCLIRIKDAKLHNINLSKLYETSQQNSKGYPV